MADHCQHWSRESGYAQASLYAACPWCEIEKLRSERDGHLLVCERLRGELSLAEEGLANAMQEIEAAKHDIERLMATASAEANEVERLRRQNERLAAALFRDACYCGCGSPQHELHRTDCPYRIACTPEAQL